MMAAFLRKYGTTATIDGIPLVTKDEVGFQTNPTLATGDAKISKDGGALANLATLPAVTPAAPPIPAVRARRRPPTRTSVLERSDWPPFDKRSERAGPG